MIVVGFIEEMTFEGALVRGRRGSCLDSRQGNILVKSLKWRLDFQGLKKCQKISVAGTGE